MKIFVVSPHPDDETLGCGGTLLKHKKNNDQIFWNIVTKPLNEKTNKKREKEITKVATKYNIKKIIRANYTTAELKKKDIYKLINFFKTHIVKIKPDIVYLPFYGDIHSDHRIIFESFLPFSKSFRFNFIKKILCYEVLSETNLNIGFLKSFKPNYFVDITPYLINKIKIMGIYKSEIKKHPFPRSKISITAQAQLRGSQINRKYAEAFEVIKIIE
tara:strand:+ start:4290 stop:4937 length:648 start_codon:yes stop_codon:yes gene_type:complete